LENGVIDVHTGINDGDDAGAANSKTVLSILKADDLGPWLSGIAVPDDGAVIIYWSGVIKA
jgi:hypothetical protein